MEELLPLAHHSQVAIVHIGNFKHQALLLYSSEFLDVHLNAAITGHYPHRCIGYAHFDAHSSGEGKTHCTEAARGNMAIEAGPYVVACRPHLVLSHIGDNNGLAMCFCTNSVQDAGGIGMLVVASDAGAALVIHGLPTTYFAEPCLVIAWLDCLHKGRQGSFGISHNRHGSYFDLVHLRGINVDVDKARTWGKFNHFAGDAIVEAQPHTDNQIRIADSAIDMGRPVHTWHTDGEWMCFGKGAETQKSGDHWNVCFLSKGTQLGRSVR